MNGVSSPLGSAGRIPGGGDMTRPDITRGQNSEGPGETEPGLWDDGSSAAIGRNVHSRSGLRSGDNERAVVGVL